MKAGTCGRSVEIVLSVNCTETHIRSPPLFLRCCSGLHTDCHSTLRAFCSINVHSSEIVSSFDDVQTKLEVYVSVTLCFIDVFWTVGMQLLPQADNHLGRQPRRSLHKLDPAPKVLTRMIAPSRLKSISIHPTVTAGITRSQASTTKSFQIFDCVRLSVSDCLTGALSFSPFLGGAAIGCPCQSVIK